VVLACTHFPLLADELRAAFGPGIRFVDGAAGIARRITALTEGHAFDRTSADRFVFTGDRAPSKALVEVLASYGLPTITPV
jgi:glutamate racemase